MRKKRITSIFLSVLLTATMVIGSSNTLIFAEKMGSDEPSYKITDVGDEYVDPVELSLTLDKASYEAGESVKSTLKIKNNYQIPINVSLTNTAPEGYEIGKADSVQSVAAGETKEVVVVYNVPTMVAKQKLDISSEFKAFGTINGYETSDKKIARVNKKGSVKFKKTGTVTIKAYQGRGKQKTFVSKKVVLNVEVPKAQKKVQLNAGATADAISFFDGITNAKPTKWTSSKTSVATVDETTGEIKALSAGNTTITAYFGEGKNAAKYPVKIKIPKGAAGTSSTASTKETASDESHITAVSEEKELSAEATAKANDANVTFKSTVKYTYGTSGSGEISASFADDTDSIVKIENFTTSERNVLANTATDVTFKATLRSRELLDSPTVKVFDGDGNEIDTMNDNGEDGDQEANDGIFTATVTLNNAKGEKKYHAEFDDTETNVQSIYFYEPINDDERAAASGALAQNSADDVETYIKDNSAFFQDAVRDGDKVTFTTASGINGVWEEQPTPATSGDAQTGKGSLISKDVEEIEENVGITEENDGSISSVILSDNSGAYDPSKESKVLVVRPFHGTEFPYEDFADQGIELSASAEIINDDYADLDVFKSFGAYGTVLLDSHGTTYKDTPYLLTGYTIDPYTAGYDADFQAGRVIVFNSGLVAVGPKFFEDYYSASELKNTKLFLGTCYSSAADEVIPKKLVAKGAAAVYGYDDVVTVGYCNDTLEAVVDSIKEGDSTKDAYEDAVAKCGAKDPNNTDTDFLYEGIEATQGQIVGQVFDYSNNEPIPGAFVSVWNGDTAVATEPVAYNGSFTVFVAPGTYDVVVSAYGYVTDRRTDIEVEAGGRTRLGNAIMLRPAGNTSTKVYGIVDDAVTAKPIKEAIIRFRKGRDNTTGDYLKYASGTDVVLLTDADGKYEITDLPYGYYTMEVSYAGYSTSYRNIVAGDSEENQNVSLSRFLGEGAFRVKLLWNTLPYDIDSHMVGPTPDGAFFHTWYSDMYAWENGTYVADLDRDDTDSEGPEVTTVRTAADGKYYFFVHNYSADRNNEPTPLAGSGAYAEVYRGDSLIATYHVPVAGSGVYWNVFMYDSVADTFTETGTISDTAYTGDYGITLFDQYDNLAYDDYDDPDDDDDNPDADEYSIQSVSGIKDENYLKKAIKEDRSFVPAK